MPGGELEPIGRSGPALAEVAAEMSEIFARAGVSPPAPGVRRPAAVAALRPSRGGGPSAILLTAAAAGLVGLGAGAFVIRTPGPPAPAGAKVAVQSHPAQRQPQIQTQPQAKPQPQPQAPPPIALAEAVPPPAAETEPAPKASAATKASTVRAARARARFRLKLARLDGPRPAQARPPIRLGVPAPVAQPASCEQDAGGEDCRRAVVQADRHLRAVYENAIARGVSRRVLVDYRDRWADLRERNNEDPARLIESYGALAYDLRRETADDQDDAPRPRSRSGLRALADLLLPWW
jgi:hypothetical protein